MSQNKDLWRRVCVTDPAAVKPITGKQYNGNSPKPYWIVERMTEEFGPCGIGWGFTILSERFERFGEGKTAEVLHIASVRLWYILDGKRGELEQVGQTRASYTTSKDKFLVDEDAPKKSVTDALVKCASYLGFAGDIFSGRWDDSKYVAQAAAEWKERKSQESGAGMAAHIAADWLIYINDSANGADLKARTAEAVQAAQEVNDDKAAAEFTAAAQAKIATAKAAKATA